MLQILLLHAHAASIAHKRNGEKDAKEIFSLVTVAEIPPEGLKGLGTNVIEEEDRTSLLPWIIVRMLQCWLHISCFQDIFVWLWIFSGISPVEGSIIEFYLIYLPVQVICHSLRPY